jgi:transposase InsO family protein
MPPKSAAASAAFFAAAFSVSARQVIELIPGWIDDYNTFAPHSSLGMKTPAEFRRDQQTVAHRVSHEIGVRTKW